MFCIQGGVEVTTVSADGQREFTLTADGSGLLLPSKTWSSQRYAENGSVLLVLASRPYEPDDYFEEPSLVGRSV